MKNRYIASFEAAQIASKEVPAFRAWDTLRLGVEIKEGEKKRVQTFEGVVIGRRETVLMLHLLLENLEQIILV